MRGGGRGAGVPAGVGAALLGDSHAVRAGPHQDDPLRRACASEQLRQVPLYTI